jgi:uncharacterized membrane protein
MITISRMYDTYDDASLAVTELERAGIPRSDISMVASNAEGWYKTEEPVSNARAGAGAGAAIGGALGLLAGVGLLAIPGLGPIVAAGWAASTLAGAIAGGATGGVIGALTKSGVNEEDAHLYAEGVRRGGTIVIARVPDAERARAEAILDRTAVNLGERATAWESSGWNRFDPEAPPYTADEIRRERELYRTRRM